MVCYGCFAFFLLLGGLLVTLVGYYPIDMDHNEPSEVELVPVVRRPHDSALRRGIRLSSAHQCASTQLGQLTACTVRQLFVYSQSGLVSKKYTQV